MSTERKIGYKKRYKKRYPKKRVNVRQRKMINSMITSRLRSIPEKKFLDNGWGNEPIGTSGYQIPITHIGQGDDIHQRIGNELTLTNLFYRFSFSLATTDVTNIIRFCIIQIDDDDTQFATTPPYSTFFTYSTAGEPSDLRELMSPLKRENRTTQFKMLVDKHIQLTVDRPIFTLEGLIKKIPKSKLTYFTSGFGMNQIYICAWSDSSAVPHPLMSGISRISYTDL